MLEEPISILHQNIIHFFENLNKNSLSMHDKYIKDNKINQIVLINQKTKITFPKTDLNKKEIYLQETYLSHLWSLIYALTIIHEEGVQKKYLDKTFNGIIDYEYPLMNRARQLLDWSQSLKTSYSEWNIKLPNPSELTYCSEIEKDYIGKVNNLYQSAVSFVLYHELAHLVSGHKSYLFKNIPDEEFINLEREADEFAFDIVVSGETELDKVGRALGAVMIFSSSILLSNKEDLQQKKHQDVEQRLLTFISKLNFESKNYEFYFNTLASLIINLFLEKEKENLDIKICGTAEDLLSLYCNKLDKIKENI